MWPTQKCSVAALLIHIVHAYALHRHKAVVLPKKMRQKKVSILEGGEDSIPKRENLPEHFAKTSYIIKNYSFTYISPCPCEKENSGKLTFLLPKVKFPRKTQLEPCVHLQ